MTEIRTQSAAETFAVGVRLGRLLESGDFIALIGNLGAGKTQFTKGLAVGLGIQPDEPVTSPTYTLLNLHEGRLPLYHFDLYRLASEDDVLAIGYEEYADAAGICVVEWAERLGNLIPDDHLKVYFSVHDVDIRLIRFEPAGTRADELVGRLFASVL